MKHFSGGKWEAPRAAAQNAQKVWRPFTPLPSTNKPDCGVLEDHVPFLRDPLVWVPWQRGQEGNMIVVGKPFTSLTYCGLVVEIQPLNC